MITDLTNVHIKLWHDAMAQTEYFSLDKTAPQNIPALWDSLASSFDTGLGSDMGRVFETISILDGLGALSDETVAIDIGCGTGAFSIELARRCKRIYALDLSEKMLNKLEAKAKKEGMDNIICLKMDWKRLSLGDLDPEINLTLSCLNTGINDFESLDKMTRLSKGWNCYITAAGKRVNQTRNELQEIIFGRTLNNAMGNDIIFPFNIIYSMGYMPSLHYIPCNWRRVRSPEQALLSFVEDFSRYKAIDEETVKKLELYVKDHLNDDGMYLEQTDTKLGMMAWKSV